jgi:four helix bundle protein
MKTHKDLKVWKKSIELVTEIYKVSRNLPKEEQFGLISQMRRAAVSVPANIAEGFGRKTTGELRQSIGIAKGSLAELETLLIISKNLGYIDLENQKLFDNRISEIFRIIGGLNRKLE